MEILLYKFLFVVLYIVLTVVLLSTAVGIPGNWILVGVALIVALISKFAAMTWPYLLLCVGLAVVGEVIEAVLGAVIVARRGGSKWGVIGSIAGGLAGVLLGAPVVPPLGSVIFGFAGAFTGAVLGELARDRQVEPALRIGFWSLVGKAASVAAKLSMGCVILWIIVTRTWP
ncbi:MAG: DUF456 domain-containing protein [Candidatus Krumholzibacteria bacterium]